MAHRHSLFMVCLRLSYLTLLIALVSEGFYSGCRESTRDGECCVFPFTYKNKVYHYCTRVDHSVEWCATTEHFNTVGKYGNCSGRRRVFPLNSQYRNLEMDGIEPSTTLNGTLLTVGPWGRKDWARQMSDSPTSYIKFPVHERGGTNDFTILSWLYIEASSSQSPNNPGGWGLTIALDYVIGKLPLLHLRFIPKPSSSPQSLLYDGLEPNEWNFVGITFDPIKQLSALWVNDQLVGSLKSTIYDLVFKNSLWLGSRVQNMDSRYLRGRIACVQFFTAMLTKEAMDKTKYVCRDETLRICDGNKDTIKCSGANRKIRVHAANYGYWYRTKVCGGNTYRDTCEEKNSLAVIRRHCEGKQSCTLEARPSSWIGLTDPCPGKVKYLEVQYACQPALPSAPYVTMVTDVTADSAVILWESPKPGGEDIYGFNVQVYGHNYYTSFASPGNRTYIRVERLQQQKKYFVTVVAISKAGKSPPCPIKEFETAKAGGLTKPIRPTSALSNVTSARALANDTTRAPGNNDKFNTQEEDDVRVQLFPYICALLAIGVILVVSKVIFNYWRRRHPVGEPSKAIQPDIDIQVHDTSREVSSLKYHEIDPGLDKENQQSTYYSADFKDLAMSEDEGSVYEEIRHGHYEDVREGAGQTHTVGDSVYLEVIP